MKCNLKSLFLLNPANILFLSSKLILTFAKGGVAYETTSVHGPQRTKCRLQTADRVQNAD